jgi:hypothetical protein
MAMPESYPCLSCDGTIPALTAVCKSCGARYRRGVLIERGGKAPRRRIIRARSVPKPERVPFEALPWYSLQTGTTRAEAIANMHAYYNRYPGRRRKSSEESFEVTEATYSEGEGWWLTVRRVG